MGRRKIRINQGAAESIAAIAWYIESKGMLATAEKFSDNAYDFISTLSDDRKSYTICREPVRAALRYKCITYKKKYTIVFIETQTEITVVEFIPSKNIHW